MPRQIHPNGRGGAVGTVGAAAADAVLPAAARPLPQLVVAVAGFAGAVRGALGVEASVLVKADLVGGVRATEDVAASAAVVAAGEEAEWGLAGWRGAGAGGGVGLVRMC